MLTLDNRIQKLVSGEVNIPAYLDDFNAVNGHWYPHPPCLVPLFLGYGASYKGVVQHFFCDRKVTYVEYFLEQGYISEIARNTDQFITLMVLRMIITKDALTDDIIKFCEKMDYKEAAAVDRFTVDYGDDPKDFEHLPYFDKYRPFKYLRSVADYDGDFPSSIYSLNTPNALQNSSLYEIADEEKLSAITGLPEWLIPNGNNKGLFNNYLSKGQYREAWFTLNSKGWVLSDLADSLNALKEKSGNKELALVAENWLAGWQIFKAQQKQ